MTLTPYEEINELINKMKEAKETLNGTDAEYFSGKQLNSLIEISKEIVSISNDVLSGMEKE